MKKEVEENGEISEIKSWVQAAKTMCPVPEVHLRTDVFNIPLGVDTISKYNFLEFQ